MKILSAIIIGEQISVETTTLADEHKSLSEELKNLTSYSRTVRVKESPGKNNLHPTSYKKLILRIESVFLRIKEIENTTFSKAIKPLHFKLLAIETHKGL